jgi:hypothetical protein
VKFQEPISHKNRLWLYALIAQRHEGLSLESICVGHPVAVNLVGIPGDEVSVADASAYRRREGLQMIATVRAVDPEDPATKRSPPTAEPF